MNLSPQRKRLLVIFAAIALALGVGLAWFLASEGSPQVRIVLLAGPQTNAPITRVLHGPKGEGVVIDDLRQKFPPGSRVCFQLISDKDIALAVWATGVEVRTPDGWMIANEERRGEPWRLKAGVPHEVCVERPRFEIWRAYVRYGLPMKGAPLLKVQLHEAWKIHSFSNWNGKAWGGGRWSGLNAVVSEPTR